MQISQRIKAFSSLGDNLESFVKNYETESTDVNQLEFNQKILQAKAKNSWFSIENILYAIKSWSKALSKKKLNEWLLSYDLQEETPIKKIGIITAGNIPMVGFHDIISIILSGNKALIKLSSNDDILIPYMLELLVKIEPNLAESFEYIHRLEGYDAVIATGSDNTARYFESYFGNVPHIIRKNRTSVAVLTGDESEDDLSRLSEDIMRYYGLGCRNVTKIFVSEEFDLDKLFKALFPWKEMINHHKYANNYDYHKTIFLMKGFDFVENGFLLVKEDDGLFSPISSIFYVKYDSKEKVEQFLISNREQIQCVVGNFDNGLPFGKAQQPELWDYADNIDTISWLINLN